MEAELISFIIIIFIRPVFDLKVIYRLIRIITLSVTSAQTSDATFYTAVI